MHHQAFDAYHSKRTQDDTRRIDLEDRARNDGSTERHPVARDGRRADAADRMTAVYPPHCPNLPIPIGVVRAVMELELERV